MDINLDSGTVGGASRIACALPHAAATTQALEWVDLQRSATSARSIEGGARLTLPASLFDVVTDLAGREENCCGFLTISTTLADGRVTLDITSDNPDALPVISALAGLPLP